jgi:hypothetical protein
VTYILDALRNMKAREVHAVDVRPEVQRAFNARIQHKLGHAVWTAGGCASWYIDPRSGRNTTLWPGFTFQFRRATATFRLDDYETWPRRAATRDARDARDVHDTSDPLDPHGAYNNERRPA